MLIRFRVANHRSLRADQDLSFVTALAHNDGVELPEVGVPVLPVMSIHGANASGKSNVLDALRFMRSAVLHSQRSWLPQGGTQSTPFAFGKAQTQPSLFELDFFAAEARYVYGFELDRERILCEWLFQFGPTRRRRMLFERKEQNFEFGASFPGLNQTIAGLTRPNSLFLSAAAQNGHKGVEAIWSWFAGMRHAGPTDLGARIRYTTDRLQDQRTLAMVTRAIRAADLGLTGVKVIEKELPEEALRYFESLPPQARPPAGTLKEKEVRFQHGTGEQSGFLALREESHGTRAWFGMLGPLLDVLERGALLCFDEIDSHLHAILVKEIVKAFKDPAVNRRRAQLLFTTQHTFDLKRHIADDELRAALNRDEVWLTEKDDQGQTRLYPLSDYKPRQREDLERAYLAGRFGAIPFADIRGALINALWGDDSEQKQVRAR